MSLLRSLGVLLLASLCAAACGGATDTVGDEPLSREPASPVVLTIEEANAKCAAVDPSGWPASERQVATNADDLARRLEGDWFLCTSKSSGAPELLFEDEAQRGMRISADGRILRLGFDASGKVVALPHAPSWTSLTELKFEIGGRVHWAVFHPDGRAALMGTTDLGSSEFVFVRLDG